MALSAMAIAGSGDWVSREFRGSTPLAVATPHSGVPTWPTRATATMTSQTATVRSLNGDHRL